MPVPADTGRERSAEQTCTRETVRSGNGRLEVDLLPPVVPVEVVRLDHASLRGPSRAPHRHDYHELIWVREGRGEHRLDGERVAVRAHAITVIGRGQVHVFERAAGLVGAVVRFGDELLSGGGGARRAAPGWLLAGRGGVTVTVPASDGERLEAVIGALEVEAALPPDARSPDILGHLLATLLLWVERWYDAGRTERRTADDMDIQLHRHFTAALEADFAAHHDAAHYAAVLRVPQAALSRALVQVTGRSTKELVLDRVMIEAARLLRYTNLSVGEVAYDVGFVDQLYFSRAFKRRFGLPPIAYRSTIRGLASTA